jgi:hypothetical protein
LQKIPAALAAQIIRAAHQRSVEFETALTQSARVCIFRDLIAACKQGDDNHAELLRLWHAARAASLM